MKMDYQHEMLVLKLRGPSEASGFAAFAVAIREGGPEALATLRLRPCIPDTDNSICVYRWLSTECYSTRFIDVVIIEMCRPSVFFMEF